MSNKRNDNMSELSIAELFRIEVETQSVVLTSGLLALERNPGAKEKLQDLMRAAHSLKGAARIAEREAASRIAHAMEDCLVKIQKGLVAVTPREIDTLLRGVDMVIRISQIPDDALSAWRKENQAEVDTLAASLSAQAATSAPVQSSEANPGTPVGHLDPLSASISSHQQSQPEEISHPGLTASTETLRVIADNLNRLVGLAGEVLVSSRWLDDFVADSRRLQCVQRSVRQSYDRLSSSLADVPLKGPSADALRNHYSRIAELETFLANWLTSLDRFNRRFVNLSSRLYDEALNCRMRPFGDGVCAFPRMVRDLALSLGKKARLEVGGEGTTVDRDILDRLQAPLDHLLRNAIDHGIETPDQRRNAGKPECGVVHLDARHSSGILLITVRDDGRGADPEAIRHAIIEKKLATAEMAAGMSEAELLQFLLLPGFSLKTEVSEISGRGVGLDVVQTMVKQVGGNVRVFTTRNAGTSFQLELPLTLSVLRTLLVEVAGEPYAFPLARIEMVLKLPQEKIHSLESHQHFTLSDEEISLIRAAHILELNSQPLTKDLFVVVVGQKTERYGIVVDRFLGEEELVVRPLDPRLGKLKNVNAAALMSDGTPVLIIDVDDLSQHIGTMTHSHHLKHTESIESQQRIIAQKRVLVVDDSLTVRELERKLLVNKGYIVDVAVDGMEGWNSVRTGNYDLIVTDVDMPRLDGIELVKLIRKDHRLKAMPVMIVSYKDREEDRQRGLDAGADYYLTKGSFHDETLVRAVSDLIGRTDA